MFFLHSTRSSDLRPTRRWVMVASAAAVAGPAVGRPAFALGTDAHAFNVGDIEVLVLSDGHLTLPSSVLAPNAPKEQLDPLLVEAFGAVTESVEVGANVTLLKTGGEVVLVDNGAGNKFQPTEGKLAENLVANGIDPASVSKVVFTHAHPDHIWGTLLDSGALFLPNAAYYVAGTEWDFWTNPDLFTMLPENFRAFGEGAQRDLAAVKDRVTMVTGGDTIAPGVSVIDAPGHTPGHIALLVEGGDGLILTADAIPNEVVSVRHPDWVFGVDADPETASRTRSALLDRAAADGNQILGFHFRYPGLGRVETTDGGFRFLADA